MKTFGSLRYAPPGHTLWILQAEPHVVLRAKRVFEGSSKQQHGVGILVTDSPRNARELYWFLQRFPLLMSDEDFERLERGAAEHEEKESLVDRVLAGKHKRKSFTLAVPARDYQQVAADLWIRVQSLLLADDVGVGKTASAICGLTEGETRPALVVTLPALQKQWQRELARFAPQLSTHVIRKREPYDLDEKTGKLPDVTIASYSKLAGWSETVGPVMRSVVWDEVQELRHSGTRKHDAARVIARAVDYRIGLSVGPASRIELAGGPFGVCWTGTIEEAWAVASATESPTRFMGYDVVPAVAWGVRTRAWTGERFGWQPVRTFIRHACSEAVRELRAGGARLTVTDDHSVFLATSEGIEHAPSAKLKVGDVLVGDDGCDWEVAPEEPFDVLAVADSVQQAQVVVDLADVTRKQIGVRAWEWQNFRAEATYGDRLPIGIYRAHAAALPRPTGVYVGRGRAPLLPPRLLLSSWAYVLGFFIGDGWATKDRVAFAVDEPRVPEFTSALEALGIGLRPKRRKMRGASSEVRCSHRLFAAAVGRIFGGRKCFEKRIPLDFIFTWPRSARLQLLAGLRDSDGSKNGSAHSYVTTSELLAHDVRLLVRSLGVTAGLHDAPPSEGGTVNGRIIRGRHQRWAVFWSGFALDADNGGHRGKRFRFAHSRGRFNEARLAKVTRLTRPEFVYDLEIAGHPSFVADGLLCHNTATPFYNYGDEMYDVMDVVAPGELGSKEEFRTEFCSGGSLKDASAFGLHLRSSGLMLRRTRADVGRELPGLSKVIHHVDVDEQPLKDAECAAERLASIILSRSAQAAGDVFRASQELSVLLRQATGVAKAPYVAEFVRMLLEGGESVVLAGWHRSVYEIWNERLAAYKPAMYTGSESPNQKDEARRRFTGLRPDGTKGERETRLLLLSLRSGVGLDGLQHACRNVVIGELDWSPGVHEQLIGRVDRDGQLDPVVAYFMLSDEGSDPIVADMLGLKREQVEGVRNPGADHLEKLESNPERIKELARRFLASRGAARVGSSPHG